MSIQYNYIIFCQVLDMVHSSKHSAFSCYLHILLYELFSYRKDNDIKYGISKLLIVNDHTSHHPKSSIKYILLFDINTK